MGKRNKKKKKGPGIAQSMDRHVLYEESVQSLDFDLDLAEKFYRQHRGTDPHRLKEDFCGTAALSTAWVERNPEHQAVGIDLHRPTLAWGIEHHINYLTDDQKSRITLINDNVLHAQTDPVDIVLCLNFSCFIFKKRELLLEYFKAAYSSLNANGIMVMDIFGGKLAMSEATDVRAIPKSKRADGTRVPGFTYVWDQARFNAINHEITCHIHFKFKDGSKLRKAFTYNWRLWTLPELQELMQEAGFSETAVYLHGWDKDGEGDDIYRRRTYYENEDAWIGYVVGVK